MNTMELMRSRHSVRQYSTKKIEPEKREALNLLAEECNQESGLHIQIFYDDASCFGGLFAKAASFKGCENYIALVGDKEDPKLEEKAGYYGEMLVLKAQELGLNTCWAGLTKGKGKAAVGANEKQVITIALGYGANQGKAHKSKTPAQVSNVTTEAPDWYRTGVEAALLAPTAVNQQRFKIVLNNGKAKITAQAGPFSIVDLGIVKCHFEMASGHTCE